MASSIIKSYKRKIFLLFFGTFFIISIYWYLNDNYETYPNLTHNKTVKYILYWNDFFGFKEMGLGLGQEVFKNCPVNTCFTTNDRFMPVTEYDAIVFHAPTLWSWFVPRRRSLKQKYIYYSKESPTTYPFYFGNGFYNWTMTYRKDSDIYTPYAIVKKQKTNYTISEQTFNKKTKLVAWLVSNCRKETKHRKNYVEELRKYIPVDIFGKCGTLKCSNTTECYQMLTNHYKFYLSFENSMCVDYVTEKLFNVLRLDVIPVVLGSADYDSITPPHSVINTNEFKDPKNLALFLLQLSKNKKEYLRYFEWKKDYVVIDHRQSTLCKLCKKLHEPLVYEHYENLDEWFIGKNASVCAE